MPQLFEKLSGPERRELHLALPLRIAQLDGIDY
jgi:hypothetical protein